jgi:hypothetical protein
VRLCVLRVFVVKFSSVPRTRRGDEVHPAAIFLPSAASMDLRHTGGARQRKGLPRRHEEHEENARRAKGCARRRAGIFFVRLRALRVLRGGIFVRGRARGGVMEFTRRRSSCRPQLRWTCATQAAHAKERFYHEDTKSTKRKHEKQWVAREGAQGFSSCRLCVLRVFVVEFLFGAPGAAG